MSWWDNEVLRFEDAPQDGPKPFQEQERETAPLSGDGGKKPLIIKPGVSPEWEAVGCILCGEGAERAVVWEDEARGHLVRCRGCGLVYRSPRRRQREITRHFQMEWTEARPAFYVEDYRRKNLGRIADWLLQRHPEPGAILDIGSSYGAFLAQFPETWERYGIEPSVSACRTARERLPGAQIISGTLGGVPLPAKLFDVITMIDTVFYLADPLSDLARLPGLLKPGGILLVESLNFANRGPVYRWMRHSFCFTWMFFYTPPSLARVLQKAGLRVVGQLDLPGHQLGSESFRARFCTLGEFILLKALKKLSAGRVDLLPHFALIAQRA